MQYIESNQKNWDCRSHAHDRSREVEREMQVLLSGGTTLGETERALMGEVRGKRVLHLMCHNGLDSISLARLGADVTAVDLSLESLNYARGYAEKAGVEGIRFLQGDVHEQIQSLELNSYDWVVMTYGILCWLNDLNTVFAHVFDYLNPGGKVILIDHHPLLDLFTFTVGPATPDGEYFWSGIPERCVSKRSYIGDDELKAPESFQWSHDIGSILSAVGGASLRLIHFKEYPWITYRKYPFLFEQEGHFVFPNNPNQVPMTFSLLAVKESTKKATNWIP